MEYKGSFKISKEELEKYITLLSIEDLEFDNKNIGKQDDYISIANVEFKNGNYITIDLASGLVNYYDNVCLFDKNGQELYCSDCNFEIDSFSLFYENDIYDVIMEVE